MPLDQAALATLTQWQRNVIENTRQLSGAQRAERGVTGVWDAYRSALGAAGGPPAGGGGAPSGGHPAGVPSGAPAGVFRPSGSFENLVDIQKNPEAVDWLLQQVGIPGATADERLQNAMLGSSFSGIDQWRRNLTGQTVQEGGADSYANNVGFSLDMNQLNRVLGEITAAWQDGSHGGLAGLRNTWQQRLHGTGEGGYQGVPDWAPGAFQSATGGGTDILGQLGSRAAEGGGLRFNLAALSSPGINLYDPSKPLFGPDTHPSSLIGMTGMGAGEEAYYRGLSAAEFLQGPGAYGDAYYNRAPGSPAPGPSPMFGAYDERTGQVGGAIRQDPTYQRWTAYGQPGNDYDAYQGIEGSYGTMYNPFTGGGSVGNPPTPLGEAIGSGHLQPGHLAGSPSTFPDDLIRSAFGAVGGAAYGYPQLYWGGSPWEQFAPWNLDEATLRRLMEAAGYQGNIT